MQSKTAQPTSRQLIAVLVLAAAAYVHGIGSLHALRNGDEMIYAQIARCTAASGQWLPLRSDMPDMVNTKPPLLFWQGILSTDWGRDWSLAALRWPSLVWTFLTAGMAGLLAWRIRGRDVATGLLAAAVYLAFLSTYRYGRPFLTNPPETFWATLCFFVMLWWRPWTFASRLAVPTLVGVIAGMALLSKSFAQLVPIGFGLAAWHLHEARRDDGTWDWRGWFTRSVPGLAWMGGLALAMFSLWFVLDPDPRAIWEEFVVRENIGKMQDGKPSYLRELVWGRFSIWGYSLTWFLNVGLMSLPLLGTLIRGWQHRREAGREEQLLWLWVGAWFLVFLLPTRRSGRYLLEVMPAVAVLISLHWPRLLPSALVGTLVAASVSIGLVAWATMALVGVVGIAALPWWHWAILVGTIGIVLVGLVDRRRLSAAAVAAAVAVFLGISSFLQVLDSAHGVFPPEAVAAAVGRVVWVPETFRASSEMERFLLPGAEINGFDDADEQADGYPADPPLQPGDLRIVVLGVNDPPPPGAIGSRINLRTRPSTNDLKAMLAGHLAEQLFSREWLVEWSEFALTAGQASGVPGREPPGSRTVSRLPRQASGLPNRTPEACATGGIASGMMHEACWEPSD